MELTRALTAVENARMEWNSARLKIAALASETKTATAAPKAERGACPLRIAGQIELLATVQNRFRVYVAAVAGRAGRPLGVFIALIARRPDLHGPKEARSNFRQGPGAQP